MSWLERSFANLLLGGLPDGGFAEAEVAFKKAVALAPAVIRHQFELGMVYRELGKKDEARKIFSRAILLPPILASDAERLTIMKSFLEG